MNGMRLRKSLIGICLVSGIVFVSCGSGVESNNTEDEDISVFTAKIYGIDAEDVAIRTGPGKKFGKLVNEKATANLGEPHYCEVDFSTKVEILEEKGEWVRIRVVDPEWLADTYIGWIPRNVIVSPIEQQKQELRQPDPGEYEILRTDHNRTVQNFDVLLKRKKFDKTYAYQFIKAFRKEHCEGNCNVCLYDSKSIMSLLGIYPLEGQDYLKMADHLISLSTFDATGVRDWYPYQDFHYRELGGKNWKKKPVN